ncbi:MAG: fused MFS/spermidine synthase [Desulfobacterales bacterium]|nr:fused MFS/spermidine synthase [Desulfobacterales bacterium]
MKKKTTKDDVFGHGVKPLILLFLLISGSCGLIYEILWMKMLTLVIGATVFSITTVLTSFMGGLALGSFLAGRFIDKIRDPLRIYGILEGSIGAYALLLPWLIAGTEPLFRFVYQSINPSFYTLSLLRFFVCAIILLVPTTLMGATLPVLSKYFVEKSSDLGRNVGLLYGLNTFGAVLGSFSAGFVLIPVLGITWTLYLTALLNLLICAGMLKLAKIRPQWKPSESKGKSRDKKRKKNAQEIIPERWGTIQSVVMVGIGISGIAAMIYQVAWTRVLSLSIGSSVYAFSLILTAFICGLALGSLVIAKFIDRRRDLVLWLALMQAAVGLSALGIVHILGNLPIFVAQFVFAASHSFKSIQLAEFAIIFGLILVPTFMMGSTMPIAVKICTTDVRRVGRFFGNVYAVNTIGAIIGSFMAGFFLIPWLGAQNSIFIAVALNIIMAGVLFLGAPTLVVPIRMAGSVATAAVAVLVGYSISQWDATILTSGPYLYFEHYKGISANQGIDLRAAMKEGRQTLYFKEGLHAVVAVQKTSEGNLSLQINGKTDASARGDAETQLMLGHLPLLLHQQADDVLVIGLGSGLTLGAVERHPVKAVDVVEIETAVVEANQYFREFNGDALNDPRVNLIVGDGRNHLALTSRQYDVIISEPSNPWISGMASLFTREFFDLAKKRLQKKGVMCQWVHAYAMSSIDFKTIVRTFQAVFPHVTVWEASFGGDYLLIGSLQDLNIDYQMLSGRLNDERLRTDLDIMNLRDVTALVDKLVITEEAVAAYTKGSPLHTDDNALLEYSAPKVLLQDRSTQLLEELYRFRSKPADVLRSLKWVENDAFIEKNLFAMFQAKRDVLDGFSLAAKGQVQDAIQKYEAALAKNPKDYNATYLFAKLNYDRAKRFADDRQLSKAVSAYKQSIRAIDRFIAGERVLLINHFALEVIYARAHQDLGVMALDAGRLEAAAAFLETSVSGKVRYAEAHNNLGVVYARLGKDDAATKHYQQAIALNPRLLPARMNLGNLYLQQAKYQDAIEHYLQVQKLKPDLAITHYKLGLAYFKQNQWTRAEREWMRTLELEPDFEPAQKNIDVVRKKLKSQ